LYKRLISSAIFPFALAREAQKKVCHPIAGSQDQLCHRRIPHLEAEEVHQFEARHPIGTKARLALALMLFLRVHRGDLATLDRQHVERLHSARRGKRDVSEKPVLPMLADIIA